MKMDFKNILHLLTLIEMTFSMNGYEYFRLLNAKEDYKSVKKRDNEVYKRVPMDAGEAWQSSNYDNTSLPGNVVSKPCTKQDDYASSTHRTNDPAWAIDLKNNYKIARVDVNVRQKQHKAFWFSKAHLFVTYKRPNLKTIKFINYCSYFNGPAIKGQIVTFFGCNSIGRYVIIALKKRDEFLQMCKVVIWSLAEFGQWTKWTEWSNCSLICGLGIQIRERICYYSPVGQHCEGTGKEEKPCNNNCPPIDGKWKSWISWTVCTKSCGGGGQRSRTRECTEPLHGGKQCKGKKKNSEECGTNDCPYNGAKISAKRQKWIFIINASVGAGCLLVICGILVAIIIFQIKESKKDRKSSWSVIHDESQN